MRRWTVRVAAAVLVLGLVSLLGSTTSDGGAPSAPNSALLWEPSWSPVPLSVRVFGSFLDTPMAACGCDLDADGKRELVVLGMDYIYALHLPPEGGVERRHLNLGSRFYAATRAIDKTLAGSAISCGDVNGDGRDDLVVGVGRDAMWVFLQQPGGMGFEATTDAARQIVTGWSRAMWLAEATGDGILDYLVMSDTETETLLDVLPGDGAGAFGAPQRIGNVAGTMRGYSVDEGSGEPGSWVVTTEGVWFCPQGASTAEQRIGNGGSDISVGDFDQDGDTDVAVGAGNLFVYWRDGDAYNPTAYTLPSLAQRLDRGDVDDDGSPEIVAWSFSPVIASVYGYADGGLRCEGQYGLGYSSLPETLIDGACADANEDGVDDVVSLFFLGRFSVLTKIASDNSPQLAPGGYLLGEADVVADRAEEIVAGTANGAMVVIESDAAGWFAATPLPVTPTSGPIPLDWLRGWLPLLVVPGQFAAFNEESLACWGLNDRGKSQIALWRPQADGWRLDTVTTLPRDLLSRLAAADMDSDGEDEFVVGGGQELQVIDLRGLGSGTTHIAWGGDVGPFATVQLPAGKRVAGFRSTSEASTLVVVEGQKLTETGISLPLSLLDLVARDVDGDGWSELAFVGLGVATDDGQLSLTIEAGLAEPAADGTWTVAGPWRLLGWPAGSIPFPFGGLALAKDGAGRAVLAISYTPGERTNGGTAWLTVPETPVRDIAAVYDGTIAGSRLVVREIGGREVVVSIAETSPPILRVAGVER